MAKVRLNVEVSEEVANLLDNLAEREDVTRTEIVKRGLAIMKAYRDQMEVGRGHIGFAASPLGLDAELIGVLTPPIGAGTLNAPAATLPPGSGAALTNAGQTGLTQTTSTRD